MYYLVSFVPPKNTNVPSVQSAGISFHSNSHEQLSYSWVYNIFLYTSVWHKDIEYYDYCQSLTKQVWLLSRECITSIESFKTSTNSARHLNLVVNLAKPECVISVTFTYMTYMCPRKNQNFSSLFLSMGHFRNNEIHWHISQLAHVVLLNLFCLC